VAANLWALLASSVIVIGWLARCGGRARRWLDSFPFTLGLLLFWPHA
jgi:hypothetical protein